MIALSAPLAILRSEKYSLWTICILAIAFLQACPAGSPPQDGPAETDTKHADEASIAIDEFLQSYFSTWSDGDIDAYAAHFHPAATIKYLEGGQVMLSYGVSEFIEMQSRLMADARQPMHEEMTAREITVRDGVAWVGADWELVQGSSITRGVDHFILVQDERGSWKIVSLVYYENGD